MRFVRSFSLALSAIFFPLVPSAQEDTGEVVVSELVLAAQPADQVLDLLEDVTGRSILRQAGLPNPPISLRVRRPLSRDEAVMALESILKLNGIAILETSEMFLKAVPIAAAPRSVPELIFTSTLDLAPTEKIFSTIFVPNFLQTSEALALIQPVLSSDSAIELTRSSGLLVTDSLLNLQRAEQLLIRFDQPTEVSESIHFYPLRHMDASQVVNQLNALRDGPLARYLGQGTTFIADERTNQILIITKPATLGLVQDIIRQFDEDVKPLTRSRVFYIKHAQAEDIVTLINALVTGQRSADESASGGNRQSRSPDRADGGEPPAPVAPVAEVESSGRLLQFSQFITLVSDERSNSIVVYGTESDLNFIEEIISKIDILLAQVRIEVVIAEVALTKGRVRGIDAFGLEFNVEGDSALQLARDGDGNEIPLQIGGLALDAFAVRDFSIRSVFNAAQNNGDITVLSSPTIVTTHNKEATIDVVSSRPIVTGSLTDSTGVSTRSTIQFRDIGIKLKVKPLVGNDGVIQMEIEQTVENIVSIISGSGNRDLDGQPIIGTRQATSFITVGDREMIILGGLQERNEAYTKTRLALVGRIPVLGDWLFTRRTMEQENRELIIFIKPIIIDTPAAATRDALRRIQQSTSREDLEAFMEEGILPIDNLNRIRQEFDEDDSAQP